jgi:hypothetical protein
MAIDTCESGVKWHEKPLNSGFPAAFPVAEDGLLQCERPSFASPLAVFCTVSGRFLW